MIFHPITFTLVVISFPIFSLAPNNTRSLWCIKQTNKKKPSENNIFPSLFQWDDNSTKNLQLNVKVNEPNKTTHVIQLVCSLVDAFLYIPCFFFPFGLTHYGLNAKYLYTVHHALCILPWLPLLLFTYLLCCIVFSAFKRLVLRRVPIPCTFHGDLNPK